MTKIENAISRKKNSGSDYMVIRIKIKNLKNNNHNVYEYDFISIEKEGGDLDEDLYRNAYLFAKGIINPTHEVRMTGTHDRRSTNLEFYKEWLGYLGFEFLGYEKIFSTKCDK